MSLGWRPIGTEALAWGPSLEVLIPATPTLSVPYCLRYMVLARVVSYQLNKTTTVNADNRRLNHRTRNAC